MLEPHIREQVRVPAIMTKLPDKVSWKASNDGKTTLASATDTGDQDGVPDPRLCSEPALAVVAI